MKESAEPRAFPPVDAALVLETLDLYHRANIALLRAKGRGGSPPGHPRPEDGDADRERFRVLESALEEGFPCGGK